MMLPRDLSKLAAALEGLPILGCRPNSPSARAGLRYGDILLSVDGVATPDWATFIEVRERCVGTMVVEVFRDGDQLRFEVSLAEGPLDVPTVLAELIAERIVPIAPDMCDVELPPLRVAAAGGKPN